MSEVLVDRELLELLRNFTFLHDDGCAGALRGNIDKALAAQPAEAEGDRIASGFVILDGMAFSKDEILAQRVDLCNALESLSAVTAERDAARADLETVAGQRNYYANRVLRLETTVTAERDRLAGELSESRVDASYYAARNEQLRAEADLLRKDAERWRYVRLQGDDTHWLNLLRVDLEDFGGNVDAAVDALIDGEAPAMAAKEA